MRFTLIFLPILLILFSPRPALAQERQLIEAKTGVTLFVFAYIVISIGIGVYSKKWAKTPEQYFGATKTFGPITIALASMAAVMSAFGFIGGPGFVYKFGFSSVWITCAAGTGFAYGFWILGKRMRAMAEVAEIATLPDIAKVRFDSQAVRALLSIALLIASIAYLSSQVKGGAKLMQQLLGVSEGMGIGIVFGTVMIYMLFGGMAGHIMTNTFQGAVMLFAVIGVIVGFFSLTAHENVFEVIQNAPDMGATYIDGIGGLPPHFVTVFALVFFMGCVAQPQLLTKMYTLKDPKGLRLAGTVSGLTYAVASIVWILAGLGALYLVAKGVEEPLQDADNAAFLFVSHLPTVTQGVVMAGLLAAIMSTSDLFISLAAGAITRDFLGAVGLEIAHSRQVLVGRIVTVVVVLFAIAFAYWGGDAVLVLGSLGFGFFVSTNVPVFVIGLLWKRTSREGVMLGLIVAIFSNVLLAVLDKSGFAKLPFPYYMLPIILASATTIFVSLFTKGAAGDNLPARIRPIFKL